MTSYYNINFSDISKLAGYNSPANFNVLSKSNFDYITSKLIPMLANSIDSNYSFVELPKLKFDNSLPIKLWLQNIIDYETHIEQLALLSFHKGFNPTSFDSWRFIDFQYWFKKYLEIADKSNTKREESSENAKQDQASMMRAARRNAIPKTKMPRMRMPKIK